MRERGPARQRGVLRAARTTTYARSVSAPAGRLIVHSTVVPVDLSTLSVTPVPVASKTNEVGHPRGADAAAGVGVARRFAPAPCN